MQPHLVIFSSFHSCSAGPRALARSDLVSHPPIVPCTQRCKAASSLRLPYLFPSLLHCGPPPPPRSSHPSLTVARRMCSSFPKLFNTTRGAVLNAFWGMRGLAWDAITSLIKLYSATFRVRVGPCCKRRSGKGRQGGQGQGEQKRRYIDLWGLAWDTITSLIGIRLQSATLRVRVWP